MSSLLWSQAPSGTPVAALAFSPDGSRLLAAVATRLLLVDATTGTVLATLKSHKTAVIAAVDWSRDQARFVSGDVDGKVIIWTAQGEGLLKYSHAGAVLQATHNPATHRLCSASAHDVALWSPDQKAVVKKKVPHAIACVAWRGDGGCLAVGYAHGLVSLRDAADLKEMGVVVCGSSMGAMAWRKGDVLLVVGKEQQPMLSFYDTASSSWSTQVPLDKAVVMVQAVPETDALVLLLKDCTVVVYKDDALTPLQQDEAPLLTTTVAASPSLDRLAQGTTSGAITVLQLPSALFTPPPPPPPPPQQQKENEDSWEATFEQHITASNFTEALALLAHHPIAEPQILALARAATDPALVHQCGQLLGVSPTCERSIKEVYLHKLGDISALMRYYTRHHKWPEALALAQEKAGLFDPAAFLPYAEWLLAEHPQTQFDAAMAFYYQHDRAAQATPLVRALVRNAVIEGRFRDASYYCWVLAVDAFAEQDDEYARLSTLADVYAAFAHIHAYTQEPFTCLPPLTLFQVACFLLNTLGSGEAPFGVSKVATWYTITTQAKVLGATDFAQASYANLLTLNLHPSWRDTIEMDMLHLQARPVEAGKEEEDETNLRPVCYRCGHVNPLLNPANQQVKESLLVAGKEGRKKTKVGWVGDVCVACGHPFIRSMLRFGVLPLVEFVPDPSLCEAEALALLREESGVAGTVTFPPSSFSSGDKGTYAPVVVDAATLRALRREEVFVCLAAPSSGAYAKANVARGERVGKARFFRNVLHPDIPVALSQPAQRFFSEEDFEMAYLQQEGKGRGGEIAEEEEEEDKEESGARGGATCPFSRMQDVGEYGAL